MVLVEKLGEGPLLAVQQTPDQPLLLLQDVIPLLSCCPAAMSFDETSSGNQSPPGMAVVPTGPGRSGIMPDSLARLIGPRRSV